MSSDILGALLFSIRGAALRGCRCTAMGQCWMTRSLEDAEVQDAIKNEGSVHRKFKILNTDRATFGRVGGAVAKLHGDSGFAGNLSFDMEVTTSVLHII